MGGTNVDLTQGTRKYTEKYALNDAAGVKSLLADRYRILERRFKGDTAASDINIDLNSATASAGLTDRQAEAIALVYGKWQLTQTEAARVMGIRQDSVKDLVADATRRIAAVYERWDYGEIVVELEMIADEHTLEGIDADNDAAYIV